MRFSGALARTALSDNAAFTCVGPGGGQRGGLAVIASAPDPAGVTLLRT